MFCIRCETGEVKYKTLKLCEDCHKVHKKNVRVAWEEKTGYEKPVGHKWGDLSEDKKEKYAKASTEARQTKEWASGKIRKSWYCTWPKKKCLKCSRFKSRGEFRRKLSVSHDNTSSTCKDCANQRKREYRSSLGPKAPNITCAVECECMRERRRELKRQSVSDKVFKDRWGNRGEVWGKRGKVCEWPKKTCKKCGTGRDRNLFINDILRLDGKGSICRDCRGLIPKKSRKEVYEDKLMLANTKKKKRRFAERLATPNWLTKDQKERIKDVYNHMRDCRAVTGEPYEVNHVVPLRGENVCGLHVPWNLEVLPRYVNTAIGNNFDGGW